MMKRFLIPTITMAAVFGGCSNETIYETDNGSNTSDRVPITISTYVPSVTRADAEIATIESLSEDGGGFYLTGTYDSEANGETSTNRIFADTYFCNPADGSCHNEEQTTVYWPADKDAEVDFIGLYPSYLLADELATMSRNDDQQHELTFTADGKTDYMVAYTRTSLTDTGSDGNEGAISLTFKHILAQVLFYIKCNNDGLEYTLKNVTLSAPKQAVYNLATGSLVADGEMQDYVFLTEETSITTNYTKPGDSFMLPMGCTTVDDVVTGSKCTLTISYDVKYTETSTLSYTKSAEIELVAGYVNNINVEVSGSDVPITIKIDGVDSWPIKFNPNGHEYVDLGLPSGLLWATCNVGASNPEEFGDYFAWGETSGYNSGKTSFSWTNYTLCEGTATTMTKYCKHSSYGIVDNKTELIIEDDAASAHWGGTWRMPTCAEQEELLNNCTTTWTTVNGVNGYLLTSKNNEETLFLPEAGHRQDTSLATDYSSYWSSSLTNYSNEAFILYFQSNTIRASIEQSRSYGFSIRAVIVPN
ncbi:MAG: fimbrillin family protein [Bacteroidales bacterium]|jgi:hypothetical protein|nr:fimbrillin family protein [Bacteroidales bacterium]